MEHLGKYRGRAEVHSKGPSEWVLVALIRADAIVFTRHFPAGDLCSQLSESGSITLSSMAGSARLGNFLKTHSPAFAERGLEATWDHLPRPLAPAF